MIPAGCPISRTTRGNPLRPKASCPARAIRDIPAGIPRESEGRGVAIARLWGTLNYRPYVRDGMAKRRRPRNYKITNVNTKSMGTTGTQVRIRDIDKIDNQSIMNGYLHSVKVSCIFDTEQGNPGVGIMLYATTDNSWSDDYVITAAAIGQGGGSAWLNVRRSIKTGADTPLQGQAGGPVYIWAQITDPGVPSESVRFVTEVYGRNIEVSEA